MWVGIKSEDEYRKKEQLKNDINKTYQMIINHFNDTLETGWLEDIFPTKTFPMLYDTIKEVIEKYGYCEYCKNYIGISATIRKAKKIPVINSYCTLRLEPIKPDSRCLCYFPDNFWYSIISKKREQKIHNIKNVSEQWIKRVLGKYEEDY
jgi:hypothetical protein